MRMLRVFWDAAAAIDPAAREHDESGMPLSHTGELESFWSEGGLSNVEEHPLEIEMRFSSLADYWEPFFLGQGPAGVYVRGLDPKRRDTLRSELIRRLELRSEEQSFSLRARAWAVRGIVASQA